jgi:hypothetical protein
MQCLMYHKLPPWLYESALAAMTDMHVLRVLRLSQNISGCYIPVVHYIRLRARGTQSTIFVHTHQIDTSLHPADTWSFWRTLTGER